MRQFLQNLRNWVVFSLLLLILGWSFPAQAIGINSPIEQQVLEIIREHPEVIIESLQAYQQEQQQKLQQARQEFLGDLITNPQAIIGKSPITGSPQLKTVLVEFSDFQCPYCAEAHKTLKDLVAKYPDQLTLVYKNFPLVSIHDQALPAAQAAWAAGQQGKFWEYHDALFTNQKQLGEELYLDIAKNLDLDLAKFKRDRILADTPVQTDSQLSRQLGLSGTPSFIIKSEKFSGAVQLSDIEKYLANK
jgi:protein-disulfide isomerase